MHFFSCFASVLCWVFALGLGLLAGTFLLGFASPLFSLLFDAGFNLGERVASALREPDAGARG
jgi:hypothetical protein